MFDKRERKGIWALALTVIAVLSIATLATFYKSSSSGDFVTPDPVVIEPGDSITGPKTGSAAVSDGIGSRDSVAAGKGSMDSSKKGKGRNGSKGRKNGKGRKGAKKGGNGNTRNPVDIPVNVE